MLRASRIMRKICDFSLQQRHSELEALGEHKPQPRWLFYHSAAT